MARLSELFDDLSASIEGEDVEVSALACDSRHVTSGACFAALRGAKADGARFLAQALAAGATSVLCDQALEVGAATRVLVEDARLSLALAARRFYGDPASALTMIGVTGTNGKTTITYLLESILAAAGHRPGVIGTLGVRYGAHAEETGLTTPESVDLLARLAKMRVAGVSAVAMEASSHALAQHRVAGVSFDVGVFTNLTHDHLDYHGTLEAYFAAKASLFARHMKPHGRAVLSYDDARVRELATFASITFSASGDARAAVRVLDADLATTGMRLRVSTPRGELTVASKLIGAFNVENILAAIGVAEALALPHEALARGIGACASVPGRLERVATEPLVVVDYAHTPDALAKAIAAVRAITCGRLVCVFGCGGSRDGRKRAPMGEVAGRLADMVVLTNDNPRAEVPADIAAEVERGLVAAGMPKAAKLEGVGYLVELDRAAAIHLAVRALRPGDALLIAGKGHETYQIIGETTRHFDDREQARAALACEEVRGDA